MYFMALPATSTIDFHPRQLTAVLRSINTNRVAMGSGPMRPARAWILNFYTKSGDYALFVYLGAEGPEKKGVLFQSEPAEVPFDDFEAYQQMAAELVDSQGFDMERVEVSSLPTHGLEELVSQLPFAESKAASVSRPTSSRSHSAPTAPNPSVGPESLEAGALPRGAQPAKMSVGSFRRSDALTQPVSNGSRMQVADRETAEQLCRLLLLF